MPYLGDDYFTQRMKELSDTHTYNSKVINKCMAITLVGIVLCAILAYFVHFYFIFGQFLSLVVIIFGPQLFMKPYRSEKESRHNDYN